MKTVRDWRQRRILPLLDTIAYVKTHSNACLRDAFIFIFIELGEMVATIL